ncbi:MAG: MAPEG family protein [Acidobacteriota bacterium]
MTFDNPVFVTYVIAASLMVLKVMGQGWMTVVRMMKVGGGFLNPEDESKGWTNPKPRPGQLDPDDYVERSRRMQRNDLENVPMFLIAGLLFVLTEPVLWVAQLLFFGFVAARLLHFWAYLTAKPHEVRATFFTIGSLIVIGMAVFTLAYAII